MPRENPGQVAFNLGAFDSKAAARLDLDQYANASDDLVNYLPTRQGAFIRRPGTRLIADAMSPTLETSLRNIIPFSYNADQTYLLEFINSTTSNPGPVGVDGPYIRPYTNQAALSTNDVEVDFSSSTGDWSTSVAGGGNASLASDSNSNVEAFLSIAGASSSGTAAVNTNIVSSSGHLDEEWTVAFSIWGTVPTAGTFGSASNAVENQSLGGLDLTGVRVTVTETGGGGSTIYDEVHPAGSHVISFTPTAGTGIRATFTFGGTAGGGYDMSYRGVVIKNVAIFGGENLTLGPCNILRTSYSSGGIVIEDSDTGWIVGNADDGTGPDVTSLYYAQSNDILFLTSKLNDTSISGAYTAPITQLVRRGAKSWSLEIVDLIDGFYRDKNDTVHTLDHASTGTSSKYDLVTVTLSDNDALGGLGFNDIYDLGRLIRREDSSEITGRAYGVILDVNSTVSADVLVLSETWNQDDAATTEWWIGEFGNHPVTNSNPTRAFYPSIVTLFQNRLVFANHIDKPQTIWMGQSSGSLYNCRLDSFVDSDLTVESDDSLILTIRSDQSNPILNLIPSVDLNVGTAGGVWRISSSGAAVTATDRRATRDITTPVADIIPVSTDNRFLYIHRNKETLMDINYSDEAGGLIRKDLSLLNDEALDSGVVSFAHQNYKEPIIWCALSNGELASLTYVPEEQVIGWSRHIISGWASGGKVYPADVLRIAAVSGEDGGGRIIDSGNRDELWMLIKADNQSGTIRYRVEMLEGYMPSENIHLYNTPAIGRTKMQAQQKLAVHVDSALTYDGSIASSISADASWMSSEVQVWSDGRGFNVFQDAASTFQINPDDSSAVANYVTAGIPMISNYRSLKINAGARSGVAINKVKKIDSLEVDILNSSPLLVGRDRMSVLDVPRYVTNVAGQSATTYKSASLSTATNLPLSANKGTLSLWVNSRLLSSNANNILTNGSSHAHLALSNANGATKFTLNLDNAGASDVVNMVYFMPEIDVSDDTISGWIHILASWDTDAQEGYLYVNDDASGVEPTVNDDDISWGSTFEVSDADMQCDIGEFWFSNEYIDISVLENRRKFIDQTGRPVYLGENGEAPTGNKPLVYAPDGDPSTNKGSGGNFTNSGAPVSSNLYPDADYTLYSGPVFVDNFGDEFTRDPRIHIQHTHPGPSIIRAITPAVVTNEHL